MIRIYDTTTEQYYLLIDYLAKFGNDNDYGQKRTASAIVNSAGNIQITSANHGLLEGQAIVIDGTTNYDGEASVLAVVDDDNFTVASAYVSDETGYVYPLMENAYYLAFIHDFEDVFDDVKRRTAYLGSRLKSKEGNLMDEITIREDDQDIFTEYLQQAFDEVVSIMKSRSSGIINPFKFNENLDLDADGTGEGTYYLHFMILTDEDGENRNAINGLDRSIERTLEAYCLKEWFLGIGQPELYANHESIYRIAKSELRSALMAEEGRKRVQFKNIF